MQELLSKSVQVVNANMALVVLVGICNLQILSGFMTYISLIGLVVSFVVGIIVYGRIAAQVEGGLQLKTNELLKINLLNYIVVVAILSVPVVLYGQISQQFLTSIDSSIYGKEVIKLIINSLSIYVLPIVFFKKQHIISILAGIIFFLQHIKSSMPIIMLVVVIFLFNLLAIDWLSQMALSPEGVVSLLPAIILFNIGITYLSFLIFAAACIELIKGPRVSENGA